MIYLNQFYYFLIQIYLLNLLQLIIISEALSNNFKDSIFLILYFEFTLEGFYSPIIFSIFIIEFLNEFVLTFNVKKSVTNYQLN